MPTGSMRFCQKPSRSINGWSTLFVLLGCLPCFASCTGSGPVEIRGHMQRWHPITLTFDGPEASEAGSPNPFRDYRLAVVFTHTATAADYVVPGFFAADGNTAETSATAGAKWRAHFTPHETGRWTFAASFREGPDVVMSLDPEAGVPVAFDGASGSFEIAESDKTGRDHRGKGMLRYTGKAHLQFDDGSYFIKGGADSPENLLAYAGFDNTVPSHKYSVHAADWQPGDPDWGRGKGRAIIGALNYLASKHVNSIYFLTMNIGGDGCDVWPWAG